MDDPDGVANLLDAIEKLLNMLVSTFGVWPTLFFILMVPLGIVGWKYFQVWRADKETDKALDEKERTIQRLANENRMWRTLMLKEKYGLSDEQIRLLVVQNDPVDGKTSRENLESRNAEPARIVRDPDPKAET